METARLQRRIWPQVLLASTGLVVMGSGLAAAAYLRRSVRHDMVAPALLDGPVRWVDTSSGHVAVYDNCAKTNRPPVLLVHDANFAGGSHELIEAWHGLTRRRVYALDLPGFGLSQQGARVYDASMMRDAVADVAQAFAGRSGVDVIALGLGADFAACAAELAPRHFNRMVFMNPAGLQQARNMRVREHLLTLLTRSELGQLMFDVAVTRPALRLHLRRALGQPPAEDAIDRAYATSHQPDARIAPAFAVSGALRTPGMAERYASLRQSVLYITHESVRGPANHFQRAAGRHAGITREWVDVISRFLDARP